MKINRYGNKKLLMLVSIILFLGAIVQAGYLKMIQFAIDAAIAQDMNFFPKALLVLVVLTFLTYIISRIGSKVRVRYIQTSVLEMKQLYAERLFNLPFEDINEEKHISQLTQDLDRYEYQTLHGLIDLIDTSSSIIVSVILLFTVSWTIGLASLVLIVFSYNFSKKNAGQMKKNEKQKSVALERYSGAVKETLDAMDVIKQNKIEEKMSQRFKGFAKDLQKEQYKIDFKITFVDAFNSAINLILMFGLMGSGIYFAAKFGVSTGTALLIGTAFSNTMWPMQVVHPLLTQIESSYVILEDIEKTLVANEYHYTYQTETINKVQFDDVSLGYDDITILNNINLEIDAGDKILIYGESGSGKSTFLSTLKRMLPQQQGRISLNNNAIDSYDLKSYYSKFAFIDQKGFIFNGSLRDNITMYNNSLEVADILATVGLEDLNPEMILTDNGSNVSGGQRTRIMLARALIHNADVIVSDEVFANLDDELAFKLETNLLSLDKTLINVSHVMFDVHKKEYTKTFHVADATITQI